VPGSNRFRTASKEPKSETNKTKVKSMKSQNTNQAGRLAGTNRNKLVIPTLVLLGALLLPLVTARAAVYNFELQTRNTAANAAGNVIAMTGAGQFDTTAGAVKGGGSFTIYNSSGAVVAKGTWAATDFESFDATGGLNRGFQTGTLEINITLRPQGGVAISGLLMSVHCDEDETPGPVESGNTDGTTVGDFTTKTGGFTLFQLMRP
jgi:hypothetical protein